MNYHCTTYASKIVSLDIRNSMSDFTMIAVASSNLKAIGYDAASSTLRIIFHESGVYDYFGVPENRFLGLKRAASKGTYFNDHIKDHYRYRKVC